MGFVPHYNVVFPKRRFHASEAYGGFRRQNAPGRWSTPLGGRVWFTPPYYNTPGWERSAWLDSRNGAVAPPVTDRIPSVPVEDWENQLLLRALRFCRKRLLFIAPDSFETPEELSAEASRRHVRLVHVPSEELDPRALGEYARDEHEWAPTDRWEVPDPQVEVFYLHSSDAFVTALRYALHKKPLAEIEFIDRDL